MKFPQYNGPDMMQHMLITEGLGISHLLAVVGISSGGSYSIQLAVSYPDFMDGIVPISGGGFYGKTGRLRGSLRNSIIESCAGWNEGNYDENPKACATSYISVPIPYFYSRDWWERHIDTAEAHQRWRVAMGAFTLDVQDTRDLYYLERSYEKGWVTDTPGFNGSMQAALGSIKAKALFIHSFQDELVPPKNIADEAKLIPKACDLAIDSDADTPSGTTPNHRPPWP
ncbi:hypothetical protein [Variovorax sp. J22R115]|uniref:hypothetical protein n=1 Tax=Variovorax sp. J22R115 TaxID=3053509 RepID=UPI0025756A07|nr:hypothetical protein [Variovorax sp. J22R115]MDM0047831.1 hypothetical protein [Variovorax sp. J22R115]